MILDERYRLRALEGNRVLLLAARFVLMEGRLVDAPHWGVVPELEEDKLAQLRGGEPIYLQPLSQDPASDLELPVGAP